MRSIAASTAQNQCDGEEFEPDQPNCNQNDPPRCRKVRTIGEGVPLADFFNSKMIAGADFNRYIPVVLGNGVLIGQTSEILGIFADPADLRRLSRRYLFPFFPQCSRFLRLLDFCRGEIAATDLGRDFSRPPVPAVRRPRLCFFHAEAVARWRFGEVSHRRGAMGLVATSRIRTADIAHDFVFRRLAMSRRSGFHAATGGHSRRRDFLERDGPSVWPGPARRDSSGRVFVQGRIEHLPWV